MPARRARAIEVGRAVVHEARTEKLTFLAGSIAYHAFLSLLPLLLLLLTLLQQTENVALTDSIVRIIAAVLTDQAGDVIQQGLAESDASTSVLGLAFLVWGALRIFRGLDTAFSDIYETASANSFTDQLADGLLILGTIAVAIVVTSLIGGLVSIGGNGVLSTVLRRLGTAVGLFVVFFPMYYVFPDAEDITPIEVIPGAAFAAVGISVAQVLFTAFKSAGDGQNIIASILVLLTWLYVVGLVILLGAAVNAVLSNRSSDVDLDPVLGGTPRRTRRDHGTVDRQTLVGNLEGLQRALDDASDTVTVEVGDERFELAAPDRAAIDQQDGVFGIDTSVGLSMRWWPTDD